MHIGVQRIVTKVKRSEGAVRRGVYALRRPLWRRHGVRWAPDEQKNYRAERDDQQHTYGRLPTEHKARTGHQKECRRHGVRPAHLRTAPPYCAANWRSNAAIFSISGVISDLSGHSRSARLSTSAADGFIVSMIAP